ncbi:MAG: hypothetical protein JNK38_26790, partial [Acidobacteria bacterium]|nr:hypothetical protein [Acidobacteriota bacterium]
MLSAFPLPNRVRVLGTLALIGFLLLGVGWYGNRYLPDFSADAASAHQSGNSPSTTVRAGSTPATQEKPVPLEAGKAVEREIARGQQQEFAIALTAGQFLRVIVHQQSVDVTVAIADNAGKTIVEIGLTSVGGQESLSQEVAATGEYRLLVKANP